MWDGAMHMAAAGTGEPSPWQLNLQGSVTPVMESIHGLHTYLLVIITAITLFVLGLLIYVSVRFSAKANPVPSKTTHNTAIEVAWTVVPILILISIAIPSFRLVYFQREIPQADLTIKATGNQWYWSYEYPDQDGISFDANMLTDAEAAQKQLPRLLATDNEVVVPTGKVVRLIVTAGDVIHSWTIPSFGSKIDAIPGRLNEDWFKVEKDGLYYGQCSELCGKDHAFMPIMVRAVPPAEFEAWTAKAKAAGVAEANKMFADAAIPAQLAQSATEIQTQP
ncbi:MAG: cytochrome c oxidase subunit II [Aestuariivirgaceae bacterium]|nr:cytochrome c oxidase subunit II [Aestuariivirgaceae bacterium]